MIETVANKLELPFLAGLNAEGEPVFESLQTELLDGGTDRVRLLKSPLLARNLAAGDILKVINPSTAEYELERRSGNLCVRLFRKHRLEVLEEFVTSAIERLGGRSTFRLSARWYTAFTCRSDLLLSNRC